MTDIASHELDLYIVDPDLHTSFLAPADAAPSPWLRGGIAQSPAHLASVTANGAADDIHYARRYTVLLS